MDKSIISMAIFNSYVCLPEAFLEFGRTQISFLLSKVTDANLFGNIPGRFWRTQGVNKFLGMRKIKSSLIYIFIYLLIKFYLTISLSRISLSLYLPICRSVFLSIYLPTYAALRFPRRNGQHAVPSVR